MNCINCQQEVTGAYCSACGQRVGVKRITLKEGWSDFWARIYGFDGMFPRTLRDLTLRPWTVTERYLEGNRVLYYGPVGYFFLMVTLLLLVFSLIDLDITAFIRERQNMFQMADAQETTLQSRTLQLVGENFKIVAFMVVPFQAASAWFMFRSKALNFTEHMVLPLYVFGHLYWFSLFSGILQRYTGVTLGGYSSFLTLLFVGYAYSAWGGGKVKGLLKGIAVYIIGMVLMVVAIIILTVTFVTLLQWIAPDIFEQVRPSAN